jgi:hypothetical protein
MDLITTRARIHAMLATDESATEELDRRIDALLAADNERLQIRVAELEAQRVALAVRLRAGQRWQQGRTGPLISQDYVSQDELRTIFGIALTAPWDEPAQD